MKNILITGCNGFVGSSLTNHYLNKGAMVLGIDLAENSIIDNKNFYYVQKDLTKDSLKEIFSRVSIDLFIHCAGNANVSVSVENPKLDFDSNVIALNNILLTLKEANQKCKFIFLSSAAVYGNPSQLPIKEEDFISPISPYGLHKAICEDICKYFRKINCMDIYILRIFSAYGVGLKKQLFWDMFVKYKTIGKLDLFGTGKETRDFINIKDIVNAIDLIASNNNKYYVYNISNGVEVSIEEIAKIFANNLTDKPIVTFSKKNKQGDPLKWRGDISRLKDIGYEQSIDIESGIVEYIKWANEVWDE